MDDPRLAEGWKAAATALRQADCYREGESIALQVASAVLRAADKVAAADPHRERLEDLLTTLYIYIGRYHETQLTTEQKELLYDTVEKDRRAEYGDDFEPMDRWWRRPGPDEALIPTQGGEDA